MTPFSNTSRIVVASLAAAAGLIVVGWVDYSATRSELLRLLREHATSLRHTIAAAARSNQAAGAQAEAQVSERLLDNARLLGELDRHGALDQRKLDEIAARNQLFRVAVFDRDGSLLWSTRGPGGGSGGFGGGGGRGGQGGAGGRGMPGAGLLPRLLDGSQTEVVGEIHSPRWGGGARVAAGVRRTNGGAIIVNADASAIEQLQHQISLDRLLRDIASSTRELAYLSLDSEDVHLAHGDLPDAQGVAAAVSRPGPDPGWTEREVVVQGRSVLELAGPVGWDAGPAATLRLGMRLDGVRRAERRLLVGLSVSLGAALALSLLSLGTVWLRQSYRALRGKHALAEEALRRRDRLSAMGELASTVAHEVRNPLNAIAMSAQRLRREYPAAATTTSEADRSELDQLLGVVESETRRIDEIVRQFLEFARPPRLSPQAVDLGAEIQTLVEAATPLAASRGVAVVADTSDAGTAVVDAGQLRQAVDNLVRNAIEATPEGGTVRVTARTGPRDHRIEIVDTGHGIAAADLPRIFDLYFTTKSHGTGIGLAVTQQIVTAHGGTIEVESEVGRGTRMSVVLPPVEGGTGV